MNVHPPSPPVAPPLMSERKVGLIGAMLAMVGPVTMAMFTPAMPEIVHAFGTTEAAVKMTLSAYFGGFALMQLFCGPLSDGLGRKPVTLAFMGIYLVASLLALLAPTIEVLIAARFLQGVGAGVGVAISRAIVRDLFTGERSASIMNMIALILGIGPALAPTLGGLTMEAFGWHAIFVVMLLLGAAAMLVARMTMVETVARDLSRIRPRALARSYTTVLSHSYFLSSSLVMAGTLGVIYTLATVLSFILMDRVGLTPTQFGIGMLMQSGTFFTGSLIVRQVMPRTGSRRLVPIGIGFVAAGSIAIAVTLRVAEPSFLGVMGPVAIYTIGIAFVIPAMSTASLAPFPRIAGAAAAMSGFLQMGGGLVGSLLIALFGDPVLAMATVIPGMGLMSILAWAWWRRLPEPPLAGAVMARAPGTIPPADG